MNNRNFKIELLAPAKDKACAFAAINCGADAVYIGAKDFGARKKAGNSLEDIKEIIDYAHIFGVKIFVTINTLIFDDEFEEAKKLINELYKINTDAIIIQDMGLLDADIVPIPLHASTQCHNSTLEKVKFLEDVGFQRVVLARELSLKEIKNIAQNTSVELEAFVQGALCVSYSGQCYMSYAIGGRSANRGECAQPCRKQYSLVDTNDKIIAKNQHLLCLKDFNASEQLEELIDAGITSFKIEGRLKDENYIKNTVTFYRQKLDKILEKKGLKRASNGINIPDFTPDLSKTFNRNFCSYFLNGRGEDITSFATPKNHGEYVGKVTKISKQSFMLDKNNLNPNDGISFFNKQNELCGTKIINANGKNIFPQSMNQIQVGTKIYRNYDSVFLKQLEKSQPKRKISVDINVNFDEKETIITINDFLGNSLIHRLDNYFEPAQNTEKAKENIEKQLSKLGNTNFVLNTYKAEGKFVPFIKINEINDIRHDFIAKFQDLLIKNHTIKKQTGINHSKLFQNDINYKFNITNEYAKNFYEKCTAKVLEYGLEHSSQTNLSNKEIMTTKHCLRYSLGCCKKTSNAQKYIEPLFLVDETGKKYKLEFDCKNCQMKILF